MARRPITIAGARRRVRRTLDAVLKTSLQPVVRLSVPSPTARIVLNAGYRALTMQQSARFYDLFWDVFVNTTPDQGRGIWTLKFCGRRIRVPFLSGSLSLDWRIAIAILGHDPEIKRTYAALISNGGRPDVFLDVGSHLGTHSVLFLAHGIPTVSFDPNAECNQYLRTLCAANGLVPRIEAVAVGDRAVSVELRYPPDSTWLGSTDPATTDQLQQEHVTVTRRVEQRALDDYLPEFLGRKLLVKIDTEGNERCVLEGALRTLRELRPQVLFECLTAEKRRGFYEFLASVGYQVSPLPWEGPATRPHPLTLADFLAARGTNFAALPVA